MDTPSAAALTVLCIQDGPHTPCPLAQALEPLGYSLLHATDERSARELFARHEPQIVVTALADPAANLRSSTRCEPPCAARVCRCSPPCRRAVASTR